MAVIARDLLEAARSLQSGKSEIDQRNGASRAYYAAYHACLPVGLSIGLSAERGLGVHAQLIATLTVHAKDLTLKSAGHMLKRCRPLRVEADYDLASNFRHEDAELALKLCEQIFEKIEAATRRA